MSSPTHARTARSGSRHYVDPVTGDRYPSVTTVTRATSSAEHLVAWGARLAAGYAYDHAGALTDLERDEAVALAGEAPARYRDAAGRLGSAVHDVAEALALDAPVPAVDEQAQPYVDALLAWAVDYDVRWHAAEATVAHPHLGYAGTLDAIVELGALEGLVTLLDYKTGKSLDPTLPLQLAAYRHADELWLPHGGKARVPAVDAAHVLHLSPEGYELRPVAAGDDEWRAFLTSLELYGWHRDARELVGRPVRRPGEPIPLSDVPGLGRCRRALEAAGIHNLTDLAGWPHEALEALPGIGPAALTAITEALRDHDLEGVA